jgi:hypothetical protein
MRKMKLGITLRMTVSNMNHSIDVGGPKEIIDNYMSSQLPGSNVDYSHDQKGQKHVFTADMSIVVTDRSDASAKMTQIENNLHLLPRVSELNFYYTENERLLNNVPEPPPE